MSKKQNKDKYKGLKLSGVPLRPVFLETPIYCSVCYKRIQKGESVIDVKGKFTACLNCGSRKIA